MTQTGGLDVLCAWAEFVVLLLVLAAFVLRRHVDPVAEALKPPRRGSAETDQAEADRASPR